MLEAGKLFAVLFLGAFVIAYWVSSAQYKKTNKVPFRPLAAVEAIDEAIGRATEMGKTVHFTCGRGTFDGQTFAGLDVLRYVARQTALRDTTLIVTNHRAQVHPVTEEIVRSAHLEVGKADTYKPDNVRFISEEQQAYVQGVYGIFEREGVVANIMIGWFFAEALQLAEVAHWVGAVQIAGTTDPAQVPFLAVACDYSLIGEEIYAAGTYLNPDHMKVGTLMAQDVCKYIVAIVSVVGSVLITFGNKSVLDLLKR